MNMLSRSGHTGRMLIVLPLLLLAACSRGYLRGDVPQPASYACDGAGEDTNPHCAKLKAALAERRAVDASSWQMQGRAAIRKGNEGGNVRLEWRQQDADHYQITLAAPITRQSWQLDVRPGNAVIHGLPEGAREGRDAERLLRETTGLVFPLGNVSGCLRGLPVLPDAAVGHAVFDGHSRLIALMLKTGWHCRLEYRDSEMYPRRITMAFHGDNQKADPEIRVVVDRWSDEEE